MKKKKSSGKGKKIWLIVLAVFLGIGLIEYIVNPDAYKTEPTPAPTPTATATPTVAESATTELTYFEPTFEVSSDGSGTPTFTVRTNLPNDTELLFTIEGNGKTYQDKAIVSNGAAVAGPFASAEEPMAGEYDFKITMPLPRLQPDSVRAVIGEKGEKLSGPYVEASGFTDENVLKAIFKITS